jgi:hypothetical protein
LHEDFERALRPLHLPSGLNVMESRGLINKKVRKLVLHSAWASTIYIEFSDECGVVYLTFFKVFTRIKFRFFSDVVARYGRKISHYSGVDFARLSFNFLTLFVVEFVFHGCRLDRDIKE